MADQLTKSAVVALLAAEDGAKEIRLIPGVLRLFVTRNTGGIFGFFPGMGWIFFILAGGVMVILVVWALRTGFHPVLTGAIAGGGLGNLADRVFRLEGSRLLEGGVVDFIDLSFWPSFNVADAAISIGVFLLILRGILERPGETGPNVVGSS